ncbi:hypothetical protein GQ42DRAFT_160105 [Ramicandelaber brevisporus]|nr:hypothetical protein GQ42DRAFT_160105 [Ramicandelaber brevisporus]
MYQGNTSGAPAVAAAGTVAGAAGGVPVAGPGQIQYICADCGAETEIRPREPIRCRDCGYRVLYKKRTRRMVQFEAR